VSWSVTNFALTVGATPVAQWSEFITPFGVSGILYLVNFLFARKSSGADADWLAKDQRRNTCLIVADRSAIRTLDRGAIHDVSWVGPAMGATVALVAWFGGSFIAAAISVESLPFAAILVQAHLRGAQDAPWRPWQTLDPLTRASLKAHGPVDLIVWPEACLSPSSRQAATSHLSDPSVQLPVQDFSQSLRSMYQANCLVGASTWEKGMTIRYGLDVPEMRRYNCGCLIEKSGSIAWHEKLDLVPFKEGLPAWLDHEWVRRRLFPALGLNQPFSYGRNYRPLTFYTLRGADGEVFHKEGHAQTGPRTGYDRQGFRRTIAVAVCYESLLPWLPQYRDGTDVDAIVHLVYDGNTADHPGMMQRHLRACQYRAIETRKWNLVCSTWSGTAIIDPVGRIVQQLPAVAGVLRTDSFNAQP